LIEEPSLCFYMNPPSHRLLPGTGDVDMICVSIEFGAGLRNPLARALPEVVLIRLQDMPTLDMALKVLFREATEKHCGRQAVLDRLIEVVFIQVLRDLMDQQRLKVGLLAGLADPRLAKAINAMHAEPARAWSLEALAATLRQRQRPCPAPYGCRSVCRPPNGQIQPVARMERSAIRGWWQIRVYPRGHPKSSSPDGAQRNPGMVANQGLPARTPEIG
jgi:hypothetical protein